MSTRDQHTKNVAKRCVRSAQKKMGDGWTQIGRDLQWGLVSAEILSVFLGQDEGISSDSVREFITQITQHAYTTYFGDE